MANRELPIRSADELLTLRIKSLNQEAPRTDGRFVLYWMQQNRRLHSNFALQHAVYRAREHQAPLLIYEALRCDYPHASDRHHAFAIQAMLEHEDQLASKNIGYLPYVEPSPGAGSGLVAALLTQAIEVITDDVPCFIVPRHNRALAYLATEAGIRATAIDAVGTMPNRLLVEPCPTAAVFRRYVHKHLGQALTRPPQARPLARLRLPEFQSRWLAPIRKRWGDSRPWLKQFAQQPSAALAQLPIDHTVGIVPGRGGHHQAIAELNSWLSAGLERYGERSDPASPVASGLSPYLHWGMISPFEIIDAIADHEGGLDLDQLGTKKGAREGFWPLSLAAQSYLDELITWREIGHHSAELMPDFTKFSSLPAWAQQTLQDHQADPRPALRTRSQLEHADSPDEIWNAAQTQLQREGVIHNYLRMLWGKNVIAWKADPEEAYADLIHLNNKWSLDGRDANSWSGVLWCFGRYDRGWTERPIFGKVRYMASHATQKKFNLGPYLERYR